MDVRDLLKILRANWWIVLAAWLLSSGAGIAYSYSQASLYKAIATFVVTSSANMSNADTYNRLYSLDTLASRTAIVTTYCRVLESNTIGEGAAASLGMSASTLQHFTKSCVVYPDSSVLRLQVEGPSPVAAADLANAMGKAGLEYIGSFQELYELRQLDPAIPEPDPVSPNHLVNIVLSMMSGLLAGGAFILLRQVLLNWSGEH